MFLLPLRNCVSAGRNSVMCSYHFPSKEKLAERLMAFMAEWNETAHPFNWTKKSVAKFMAKCQSEASKTLATAA